MLRDGALLLREGGQQLQQVGLRFDALAGEAASVLDAARGTLSGVDNGMRDMQSRLRLSVDLGVQEIQATAQALRTSSDTLQTSSIEFADPARLLYGPHKAELGPGEQ
jgi:hypothetical protein